MANISDASGKLYISKKAWDGIADVFSDFISDYKVPYYGVQWWNIEPYGENDTSVCIEFDGAGRWAFDSCIRDVTWFFYTAENPLGQKIIDYLTDFGDDAAQYEFTDYEPGCEVLYRAFGSSYVSEGKLMFGIEYEDYEYTSRNIILLDFEEGYLDEEEFIAETETYFDRQLTKEELQTVHKEFEAPWHGGALRAFEADELVDGLRMV